jgi:teichuronic acid biosynthesis glycosyltransferase TuaH
MKIETPSKPEKATLSGKTILFFSLPRHDGHYTSTPWQLAVQLAVQNKVLFADNPFTFLDLFKGFFKRQVLKRIKSYFTKSSCSRNGVEVILMPFVFPLNYLPKGKWYDLFARLNHKIISRRINRVLRRNHAENIIYINSFNFYFPDLHRYLKAVSLNVYHCIDPMVKSFTLRHGPYLQKKAAKEADLIVTTAPALQHQFTGEGFPKTYLVPNAANFELFNKASYDSHVHPKVEGIEGKVLGYLGNIERRTDFRLLTRILEILNDWKLVLAGPVERQYVPGEIFEHKRIIFTGPVPYDEAPAVVKRFDVALIPFKCDEVSSGIYPLKLFEYMASGKPVVSTNFNPEILRELSDVVHTADYPEQLADFVLLAYATDSKQKREKRIYVASQNTWEQRAQLFSSYLAQELDVKHRLPYVA